MILKTPITIFLKAIIIIIVLILISNCKRDDAENKFLRKTTLQVIDSIRHYYPILRGSKLNMVVRIENTGDYPLKLYNVLPSCGCTLVKFSKRAIPVGSFGLIQMEYESSKNIGYVGIYTTIIANTEKPSHTIFFDLNVVSNPLYTKDFEEIYTAKQKKEKSSMKKMADGDTNQRGYLTDTISKIQLKIKNTPSY